MPFKPTLVVLLPKGSGLELACVCATPPSVPLPDSRQLRCPPRWPNSFRAALWPPTPQRRCCYSRLHLCKSRGANCVALLINVHAPCLMPSPPVPHSGRLAPALHAADRRACSIPSCSKDGGARRLGSWQLSLDLPLKTPSPSSLPSVHISELG